MPFKQLSEVKRVSVLTNMFRNTSVFLWSRAGTWGTANM